MSELYSAEFWSGDYSEAFVLIYVFWAIDFEDAERLAKKYQEENLQSETFTAETFTVEQLEKNKNGFYLVGIK